MSSLPGRSVGDRALRPAVVKRMLLMPVPSIVTGYWGLLQS